MQEDMEGDVAARDGGGKGFTDSGTPGPECVRQRTLALQKI